jgi:hypothetical protein
VFLPPLSFAYTSAAGWIAAHQAFARLA